MRQLSWGNRQANIIEKRMAKEDLMKRSYLSGKQDGVGRKAYVPERAFQVTGTASVRSLELALPLILEEEQEGPCGGNVAIEAESCRKPRGRGRQRPVHQGLGSRSTGLQCIPILVGNQEF